jgi:hypothetical protein
MVMARDGLLSKIGLGLGCLVALLVLLVVIVARFQQSRQSLPEMPPAQTRAQDPGWEIRYTAALALARRGSDRTEGVMGLLAEMLDQQRQMQHFRTRTNKGEEISNEAEVLQTLTNTLKAVAALHRRKPDLDLASLYPAVQNLSESSNPALRAEAERTKIELGVK